MLYSFSLVAALVISVDADLVSLELCYAQPISVQSDTFQPFEFELPEFDTDPTLTVEAFPGMEIVEGTSFCGGCVCDYEGPSDYYLGGTLVDSFGSTSAKYRHPHTALLILQIGLGISLLLILVLAIICEPTKRRLSGTPVP